MDNLARYKQNLLSGMSNVVFGDEYATGAGIFGKDQGIMFTPGESEMPTPYQGMKDKSKVKVQINMPDINI